MRNVREKTIEIEERKLLLDALKLAGIGDVTELQTAEAYSNLDLAKVKYSTYKQSREKI
jgi:hypothetical protein